MGGKSDLRFVVTHGPDLNYYDHADWAGARLDCIPAGPEDTEPPTFFFPGTDPFTPYVTGWLSLPFHVFDNVGVQKVQAFADDRLIGSSDPQEATAAGVMLIMISAKDTNPYIPLGVQTKAGNIHFRVVATDTSGNIGTGYFSETIRPAPMVTSYSPSSGPAGTRVTVRGQNIPSDGFNVTVGNANSIFSNEFEVSADGTSLTFDIPQGTGTVPIKLYGYFAEILVGTFTYTSP